MAGEDGDIIIEQGNDGGDEQIDSQVDEQVDEELDQGGDEETQDDDNQEQLNEDEANRTRQRFAPSDVRKALRDFLGRDQEFAQKNPRFEKTVTAALATRDQVSQLGGMRVLSDTLERLETHGGIEGVEQMAEDFEASQQLERGLERGDPAVITGWAKDFPDGFKRSVLPMLEGLEKLDEERYEHIASHVIDKVFSKFGVFNVVTDLGQVINAMKSDNPARADAVKHFNALAKFLGDTQSLGKKAKADPYAGRSQELDQREQELSKEAGKNFRALVRTQVNSEVTKSVNTALRDYMRQNKIFRVPANVANRLRKAVGAELQRLVNGGKDYQRNYDSVMNSRDVDRALKFVLKNANKHVAAAVKTVAPDFNLKTGKRPGGGGPRRAAGAPQARGSNDQTRRVHGVPATKDVDFGKTPMAQFLATRKTHGKAWMKDGTLAEW